MSRPMSEVKLLPCPFCGGEANKETTTEPLGDCNAVECADCEFSLMGGPVGIGWWPTPEAAAKAWNTRANLAERDAEVALLRQERERAERLAEALRGWIWARENGASEELAVQYARAALEQEAGRG